MFKNDIVQNFFRFAENALRHVLQPCNYGFQEFFLPWRVELIIDMISLLGQETLQKSFEK